MAEQQPPRRAGLPVEELARILDVPVSRINQAIDNLVARGLLEEVVEPPPPPAPGGR